MLTFAMIGALVVLVFLCVASFIASFSGRRRS